MGSLYDEVLDSPEPVLEEEPIQEEPLDEETLGLIYVGSLSDTVQIAGHEVRVRTLRIGEELEASLLANKWADTGEAGRALATALVAAAIVSVDGGPLLEGLGPHEQTLEAKFNYLRRNWYWVSVRTVYQKYDELLRKVLDQHDNFLKG
jgi:hypothetical protein